MTQLAPQKGTPPVLQFCAPAQLAVDPFYQRELDAGSRQLIARIAAGWDWNLFQPLVVAQRHDRSLWVVDGQHRLEAARLRGDVPHLPCVIFHPADPADEAAVFVELNQARRPLTPYALYNGALAAGDEGALALDTLIRGAGLRFSGNRNIELLKPGQVNIGPIRRWHARHGDAPTRAALAAMARVVRNHGHRNAALMFTAIGAVVLEHGDRLNGELFGEVLDQPADAWSTAFHARAAADGIGVHAAAAAVITDAYAEAVREVEDDAPAPPPPEPPRGPADPRTRGPADPRRSTSRRRRRQWNNVPASGRGAADTFSHQPARR